MSRSHRNEKSKEDLIFPTLAVVFWLLAALACPSSMAAQQASQKGCALLTSAEMESVIGGSAGRASGMEIPYHKDANNDHDGVIYVCSTKVGARSVSVTYSTNPVTEEGKRRGEAKGKESEEKLRRMGYRIEGKEFGSTKCFTLLPPEGQKSTPGIGSATNCGLVKGAYFLSLSVTATAASDLIPMDKLNSLAEKAASRLPAH